MQQEAGGHTKSFRAIVDGTADNEVFDECQTVKGTPAGAFGAFSNLLNRN
jgi:hypothetical protein